MVDHSRTLIFLFYEWKGANSHGIGGAEPRPDYYGDKNLRRTAM